MKNKPVALTQVEIMNALTLGVPLYTHPLKELTEYMKYRLAVKEFGEGFCITYRSELLAYADAILRKASEK